MSEHAAAQNLPTPQVSAPDLDKTAEIVTMPTPDAARTADPTPLQTRPRRSRGGLGLVGVILVAGAAVLVYTGIDARHKSNAELQQWTEAQAVPTVTLATLNAKPGVVSLNLPGRLQ